MRIFEILLALSILTAAPQPRPIFAFIAIAMLTAHIVLEGYRWQMIPMYALTFILVTASSMQTLTWGAPASLLTFILLAFAAALPTLLPIPRVPAPSGKYKVGTRNFMLTDHSRKEIYSDKDEPRRMMIQVWYPAEPRSENRFAPWTHDAGIYAAHSARFFGFPDFFLQHLELLRTPAHQDAPIAKADEKFPAIFFSHGWMGFRAQNTGAATMLASHGYIVIGMEHPYGAMVTVFPDGTVAPNNPSALPKDKDAPDYEVVARRLVKQWAEDMSFALDQFSGRENEAGEFFEHLDFSRVGVFGHSTGGGAAIQFCARDPRCKSVLGLDAFMRPVAEDVIEGGIAQPSFFMFSEEWYGDAGSRNNELFAKFYPQAKEAKGAVGIAGTKHYDFSDLPMLSPIAPQLGLKGPLNGKRVLEIVNAYLLDFFEATLKGKSSGLFEKASPYSEVKTLQ